MIQIFVYGSFMTKCRYNQYYFQGQKLLGHGHLDGYKQYIFGGLSGIVPTAGERVAGEVYEIDPKTLAKLDFFHNLDTAFTRKMVDVNLDNGESMKAEAYIWNGSVN